MWYKKSQQIEPLNKNNPQDLSIGNKIVTLDVKSRISAIGPNSPPQILEDDKNQKLILLHGNFQNNQMFYTLDNGQSGDANDFKKWISNHALPENTPYLACHGGQVINDSNRGNLNPLIKNNFNISVGEITDTSGKHQLIIKKS